ncbi:unnamed protein product [Penicillium salamii]|nr:unnamed protein product [Penicillium salamii]CAG8267794.1 unnamed protein product [Penicillium salamii]
MARNGVRGLRVPRAPKDETPCRLMNSFTTFSYTPPFYKFTSWYRFAFELFLPVKMPSEFGDATSQHVDRACDRCRKRKIRCDKTFPCSNCRCAGADCRTFNRPDKQKRSRVLISTQFEEKINLIEKRLGRLTLLVESLTTDNIAGFPRTAIDHQTDLNHGHDFRNTTSRSASMITPVTETSEKGPQSSNDRVGTPSTETTDSVILAEGPSSLTAHSAFAIDHARNVVDSIPHMGQNIEEIGKLLDTLRHITNASNSKRLSPTPLFPLIHAKGSLDQDNHDMPPLRAVVQLLREAEVNGSFVFLVISYLISPRSLSDMCLKVYFTSDYSDAEFIIVNATLNCLAPERFVSQDDTKARHEHHELALTCQTNIERALSRITLYIKPGYEMVLAFVLGIFYALNVSNTSLAWVLVGAAYQCSYSLGFHNCPAVSEQTSHESQQQRLLFWAVYFSEKTLSLRLGRSSIINSCDITAISLEGLRDPKNHPIRYFYQIVNLSSLAGTIYEHLYSADALLMNEDTRTHRALELSQKLHGYCEEARNANQIWAESTKEESIKQQIYFIAASDEVLRLSMLTLIYRAIPPEPISKTSLSLECITSARCALESHQAFIQGFGMNYSSFYLSTYVNWTILFTPFVPFIVLFCHAIETHDTEDLSRMQTFLESIRGACQHSDAIAKQHHLFSIFYNVALHYMHLSLPASPMEQEQIDLRSEVNAHLSAFGLRPYTTNSASHPAERADGSTSSDFQSMKLTEDNRPTDGSNWVQDPGHGRWFSFNQQLMGLIDSSDLPL